MTEAALLTKNLSASSYKKVISLFGEYFIKTGIFDKGLGKTLNDAYDKRLIGNYGIGFIVTKEEAEEMLETAKNFVQKLKSYLKIWRKKMNKIWALAILQIAWSNVLGQQTGILFKLKAFNQLLYRTISYISKMLGDV